MTTHMFCKKPVVVEFKIDISKQLIIRCPNLCLCFTFSHLFKNVLFRQIDNSVRVMLFCLNETAQDFALRFTFIRLRILKYVNSLLKNMNSNLSITSVIFFALIDREINRSFKNFDKLIVFFL